MDSNDRSRYLRAGSADFSAEPALFFVFAEALKIPSRRNAVRFLTLKGNPIAPTNWNLSHCFYLSKPSIMPFVILNSCIVLSRPVKQSVSTTSPSG